MNALFLVAFSLLADVSVTGRVLDENSAPVASARINVRAANGTWQAQTDPAGAFTLALPGPGDYLFSVEREGYYRLTDHSVHIAGPQELALTINSVREVFQSVDVHGQPSPVDITQTHNQESLTGTEVNDIPYATPHSLKDSMHLLPGVVEDAGGGLHFDGSSENQVLYTLNEFNVSDPISGHYSALLAVEGIRSLDYSSGRYSPQFGNGSAGVLAISTENGTDKMHSTATNFIPGLDFNQGVQLGNWYPAVGVSGPIVRGRAWFSDTLESTYSTSVISGLPAGENTRHGWAGSNLLHTQVNLNPSNILLADFLVNVDNEGRVGLGPLDPVSTTTSAHSRVFFGSIKDQAYFGHGTLVEFGYGHYDTSLKQTPQGDSLYVFSPEGRSGNSFLNSTQSAARDQGLIHAHLPQFSFAGTHNFEAGFDADFLHYDADFRRTGYEVVGLDGQLLSETLFQGVGLIHASDTQLAAYLLDTWRISRRLQITAGFREDWDQLVSNPARSPRVGLSWAPFADGNTRVSAGYALTHDAVTMDLLGRQNDQTALTIPYNSGIPGSPFEYAATNFGAPTGPLALPRAANVTLGVDHRFHERFDIGAKYLRRRARDGFVFFDPLNLNAIPSELPVLGAEPPGSYQLASLRRDDYDSVQFSVRQHLRGQYEWALTYTRSRALSNALLDYNTSESFQILPSLVPMPWDAPNRLLGYAYLPLPRKNWAVAILADARSGFPFSIEDQTGLISGPVDGHRYPFNFDLNVALERTMTIHGYRFALRGGINNLTGQTNPTAVNNTIGSPQFLQFLGNEGRHFVVRIRFFGRAI
jgi:hypothetical protein